ncbi:hypothetical protein [Aegicerativicinus sediminis]
MKLKRHLRFCAFLFFIILASIVPVPFKFYLKDNLPTFKIEQVDKKEEDEAQEEIYQLKA